MLMETNQKAMYQFEYYDETYYDENVIGCDVKKVLYDEDALKKGEVVVEEDHTIVVTICYETLEDMVDNEEKCIKRFGIYYAQPEAPFNNVLMFDEESIKQLERLGKEHHFSVSESRILPIMKVEKEEMEDR